MEKILIVKLGAKGDVVRTIPVVKALKEKHKGSKITWITKKNISGLLEGLDFIDEILTLPFSHFEKFDYLYNFDIDDEATELVEKVNAREKFGFCKREGFVSAFNLGAEYYLNTLFDDDVKRNNKKTYQEMMFELAELEYKKENIGIVLTENDRNYAKKLFADEKINKLIGIHLGASPRWPSKSWHEDNLKEFVKKANEKNYDVILFGGPDEAGRVDKIVGELKEKRINVFRNDWKNSDREFAALVEKCDVMVCGDSFALHVALALKKPTIGLFFCTPRKNTYKKIILC